MRANSCVDLVSKFAWMLGLFAPRFDDELLRGGRRMGANRHFYYQLTVSDEMPDLGIIFHGKVSEMEIEEIHQCGDDRYFMGLAFYNREIVESLSAFGKLRLCSREEACQEAELMAV